MTRPDPTRPAKHCNLLIKPGEKEKTPPHEINYHILTNAGAPKANRSVDASGQYGGSSTPTATISTTPVLLAQAPTSPPTTSTTYPTPTTIPSPILEWLTGPLTPPLRHPQPTYRFFVHAGDAHPTSNMMPPQQLQRPLHQSNPDTFIELFDVFPFHTYDRPRTDHHTLPPSHP